MDAEIALPFDILEFIVNILAEDTEPTRTKSLQALSQTCKSTVHPCRKHLFSSLFLHEQSNSILFSNLVSNKPEIILYVRKLTYRIMNPMSEHDHQILQLFKDRSTSLRSIDLWSPQRCSWDTFPPSMQALLEHLIQSPTVTDLRLYHLKKFPATILSVCTNLTRITLEDLEIIPPGAHQLAIQSAIPRPYSLIVLDRSYETINFLLHLGGSDKKQRIIDFTGLRELDLYVVGSPRDMQVVCQLIQATKELQSLYVWVTGSPLVRWDGIGRSFDHTRWTLRKVVLALTVVGDDYDPLCGLTLELDMIARNNVLEEFMLEIEVSTDASCRTDSDDWSTLDALLTASAAFPKLKRVSIDILWYLFGYTPESVLGRLKEEHFPRLMQSKEAEFSFTSGYELV